MVLESGKITEEGVERLRSRLGNFNRPRQYGVGLFNEDASRSAIRHFCQGIGDINTLYWDRSYAQTTKYGTLIAPPCFLYSVYWCSGRTGGLPGVHGFHAGNDWEWYRPIDLDDIISVQEQFTGLEEKESQFAGHILIQSGVSHYFNQRGEEIAKTRGWQIRAQCSAARERQKYTFEPYTYSREEIQSIQDAVMAEEVRGSNPRWWDDVQEAAESAGLPGSYDYGCERCCWMGHLLTNWMGDDGFLTKMYVELRLFNVVGDTTWCRGKVIAKREEGDERLVDLEIWGENQRRAVTTKGTATIRLPFKQTTN